MRRLQFLYSDWRQSTLFPNKKNDIEIPEFLQKHPPVYYRNDFIDKNTLFAKGIFCKRYNGMMGFLLMFYWMVRSLWFGSPIRNSINLIYGYKSAKKILV